MARSTHLQLVAEPSRVTLGRAVELAMHDAPHIRTQEGLAAALEIDQTTVSKWIRGKVSLSVERVAEIEELCELPRGQILAWAGYVSPDVVVTLNFDDDIEARVERMIRERPADLPAAARKQAPAKKRGRATKRPGPPPEPGPP